MSDKNYFIKKFGSFYCKDFRGYTEFFYRAGLYTKEEAECEAKRASECVAVPVSDYADEIEHLKEVIKNAKDVENIITGAKRKPVNGVLNLTDGEIEQLKEMQSIPKENTVASIEIYCDAIVIKHHTPMMSWRMDEIRKLSTILRLAEKFDLTEVWE